MSEPIGVSAVVRFRIPVRGHLAGTHALVLDQAPNGDPHPRPRRR